MKRLTIFFTVTTALGPLACAEPEAPPPAAAPAEADEGADTDAVADSAAAGDTDGPAETDGDEAQLASLDEIDLDPALAAAAAALDEDLRTQRASLDDALLAVARRQASLQRAEGELGTRLEEIASLEKRIDRRLGVGKVAQERRQERLSALAALISTMPPQAAAEMVSKMSDADAQDLLLAVSRKSDRRAAKLMALMPSVRAATLGQLYLDTDPASVIDPHAEMEPEIDPLPPAPAAVQTPAPEAATPTDDAQEAHSP